MMKDSKISYISIYNNLKDEIMKGVHAEGSLLPTEQNLATKHAVSRPTIAKVYNLLQSDGYIKKIKGLGSVVTYFPVDNVLTFGLLLPSAGESEIFSIINSEILEQTQHGKFECLWEGATASNAKIRKSSIHYYCDNYIEKQVDGILFSPLERVADANKINLEICMKIKHAGIPLVLVDRDIVRLPKKSEFDIITLDNFSTGSVLASHLIKAGCERIIFFYRPNSAFSVDMRLAGVRDTVLNNSLAFDYTNICCGDPSDVNLVKHLKIVQGKTGIICANDSTAAELMSTLDEVGIKIGLDVLICGCDDMKYSSHLRYPLTSFKQPCKEIAVVSIELLMRRVQNKESPLLTVNLSGKIVPRESSVFKSL